MKPLAGCLFFVSILSVPLVFAQDSDRSSSSGVLVSPPIQAPDQDGLINDGTSNASVSSSRENPGGQGSVRHRHAQANSASSPANDTDPIVAKATQAVIFQMTANLQLTQDQINAVGPIISEGITQQRNLQQQHADGQIDGPTLYNQRQQVISGENQQLGSVLTPDQMKTWLGIENDPSDDNNSRRSK